MQAQVDARTSAGTRGDVAVVHVEHVRFDAYAGELPAKLLGARPVRGGRAVVQEGVQPGMSTVSADLRVESPRVTDIA
ncbi:hypothetical protein GCM10009613_25740 [Pseudonocardia kongjuensis]|uniref:Uncharacterized protein n=1 Tax=Pseudonocardia kongjuensis TaxID=102227 RepID=A0ABN1XRS0_9PSEU